jgi:hypothetical protein
MRPFFKKALSSYLIVLLISSFLITLLLFSVTSLYYGEDIEDCKYVSYELVNPCKDKNGITVTIQNNGAKSIDFLINDMRNPSQFKLESGEQREVSITDKKDNLFTFVPLVLSGNELYACHGKTQTINSEVLLKCQ